MVSKLDNGKFWFECDPAEMVDKHLHGEEGPLNEMDERCPWPWDPQQLKGVPMGQYHCPYCGGMQVAGTRHIDFEEFDVAE